MQDSNYGENGKTERTRNQGSKLESKPGCLGTFSAISPEHGTYQIRAGREDSNKSDIAILGGESIQRITGKLISQLITEADKQLAYHEQQAGFLRERIEELKHISEISE
ncbi:MULTISPECIES: hypothetical protein [unclassified Nodularia (in: cyanobacteria)]|uniref:hypothetical protein n=1 Tax=unclassified Nodularia (in: cyanobacteria) TaxID=2656917 RepID=UPI001880D411|nr:MULTISPECIES: hypothetical protein [unclassified Nodularia (in: cyanobacteria)]MBE9201504.1 hypothetical protein [Nodularia sp. LEGE 06071]MCC2695799.1 hypothetical protein [Nodularia sp. LEGE 04288]